MFIEEAEREYGKKNIKVYHSTFTPMYFAITEWKEKCHMKLVCLLPEEKVSNYYYYFLNWSAIYLEIFHSLPYCRTINFIQLNRIVMLRSSNSLQHCFFIFIQQNLLRWTFSLTCSLEFRKYVGTKKEKNLEKVSMSNQQCFTI